MTLMLAFLDPLLTSFVHWAARADARWADPLGRRFMRIVEDLDPLLSVMEDFMEREYARLA